MTPPRSRLRRARKPLLVVHIVASVGLLGAASSSLLLAGMAITDEVEFAEFSYRLISTQAAVFGIPLSFISLFSGIALGKATKWGVLVYRWTVAKLALQVLVILNGALVIGPAVDARLHGDGSELVPAVALSASVAMLAAAVVLTVFKPAGRLRRSPRRQPATRQPSAPVAPNPIAWR
jgi:hypothetical protein